MTQVSSAEIADTQMANSTTFDRPAPSTGGPSVASTSPALSGLPRPSPSVPMPAKLIAANPVNRYVPSRTRVEITAA